MDIGVITHLKDKANNFDQVKHLGLDVCQLFGGEMNLATKEIATQVSKESTETNVRICAVWAGMPGTQIWNFLEGPVTLGIVPEAFREERVKAIKRWADFASWIGAPAIITHCGFIPENVTDREYLSVVETIQEVAQYCDKLGIGFWFETGQETPIVLLRTIERIGTSNLGINLDPANLILYGKGNPIDALDVIGKYVRNIHVKDGLYPTTGDRLGEEVPPGRGKVQFPEFIAKLKKMGFNGQFIIEREISGEQQLVDIRKTIDDLKIWWG